MHFARANGASAQKLGAGAGARDWVRAVSRLRDPPADRRLVQFNGVPRHTFYLHLKETEYRFNHRHQHLSHALLSLLRSTPL